MKTVAALAFLGAGTCLAACASLWGFDDLKVGDAGVHEASDDSSMAAGDGESDDATEADDAPAADDASLARDARSDANVGPVRDAARDGSGDASDAPEADAATCTPVCTGCCSAAGKCITTEAPTTCGNGGVACVDCTRTQTCIVAYPPCCGATSGACGCSAAGVLCSQN
jgi:hypothetical protein